jgi:ferric-dicitrate binding protein FerR (iron transport regulator)
MMQRPHFIAVARHRTSVRAYSPVLFLLTCLAVPAAAHAQAGACVLVPDPRNPPDKILRCGSSLTIKAAAGTIYDRPEAGQQPRESVKFDSGALLIEFHATRQRTFQILTPVTVASVRGTRWAMEVNSDRASTLVLAGRVRVQRLKTPDAVVLRSGQGVDVTAATGPLIVKRWAPQRVKALLARFGQ